MWGIPSSVEILSSDEMIDDSTPEGDTYSGLGNANDGVFFYNAGGTLLSSYTWVQNVRGTTFEASKSGADLGLSVVGEFGAHAATQCRHWLAGRCRPRTNGDANDLALPQSSHSGDVER